MPIYIYEFLFTYNIYFVAGILLYTHFEKVNKLVVNFSKIQLLLLIGLALAAMYGINFYMQRENNYSFLSSAALGILLIIFFLKYQVRIPWLMSVGRASYSLYITHFASVFLYLGIYWLIIKPQLPYILNYFVWMPAVLFVLLMGWIQYSLVEKRTKNLLNFLRKKNEGSK
jgi:peptidoglycan/LPS O-acetylase OafA/YrhL